MQRSCESGKQMNVIKFRKVARKCYCGKERTSKVVLYCADHTKEILDKYYDKKERKNK